MLWLSRLGWRGRATALAAVPGGALVLPAAAGWLSPAGLVLWGPVTTVLGVAVVMSADPMALVEPRAVPAVRRG